MEAKKDEYLLTNTKEFGSLSEEELLALKEGMACASDVENGLRLNKGTLRRFAQAESAKGVKTYDEYGIGRPGFSKRYLVRMSQFTEKWSQIKDRIKVLNMTQQRFKVPKAEETIFDLIEAGGVFKLSSLEGRMLFKVRALKHRYYELQKRGEDPKKAMGIYKDGKLFLVDMSIFGPWYASQEMQ